MPGAATASYQCPIDSADVFCNNALWKPGGERRVRSFQKKLLLGKRLLPWNGYGFPCRIGHFIFAHVGNGLKLTVRPERTH